MPRLIFVSHPEVKVDAAIPVDQWGLNAMGQERAAAFAKSAVLDGASALYSSAEVKAQDTARIIGAERHLTVATDARLGENDRTATGFLPPTEFEAAADVFFANPEQSFRGWERAIDAQARIFSAIQDIASAHGVGDLAIVSHGAVGTLAYCHASGIPISRAYDQPSQGHFWCAELPNLAVIHGWRLFA